MRKIIRISLLSTLATVSITPGLRAQDTGSRDSSAHSRQVHKTAKHKVWTNDSLPTVRHPWDEYADQKAAAVEPPAQKPSGSTLSLMELSAHEGTSNPIPAALPSTLSETDQRIAEKESEIRYHQDGIQVIEDQVRTAPPEKRERLTLNLIKVKAWLETAQGDLKTLENRRKELMSKSGHV